MGVEEQAPISLSLYPNPVTNFVELTADHPINGADVVVYDATGIARLTLPIASGSTLRFDTSSLAQGTYFIRVRSGDPVITLPFIKL